MISSPVNFNFFDFIVIDQNKGIPKYLQIVNLVIKNIENGNFGSDSRLPGTRIVAQKLNIHRKTVIAAYEELTTSGYIIQIPNVGSFVSYNNFEVRTSFIQTNLRENHACNEVGFHYDSYFFMEPNFKISIPEALCIDEGFPDERIVAVKEFYEFYHRVMKRKLGKWKEDFVNYSHLNFNENFENYLSFTRNLYLNSNEFLTTRTIERALHCTIDFLINQDDLVIVGNLSYYKANMLFLRAGAKIQTISVDKDGLVIDELNVLLQAKKIKCVYLNPNSHFPMTVRLSDERKMQLIELAKQYNFAIIEDHSQNEVQYNFSSNSSLFSSLSASNVIQVGGFGSALLGHIQTGYIVAHPKIISEIHKYVQLLDPQGDKVLQHTLAELIKDGDLYRFHNKAVEIYRLRRDFVINWILQNAQDYWEVQSPNNGLAIWIEFKNQLPMEEWRLFCLKQNVIIPRELIFQNKNKIGVRIGFGSMDLNELQTLLPTLLEATILVNKKSRYKSL